MMKVFAILCAVFVILVCLATPARSEALPEDCVRSKTPRTGSLGVYGVAVTCNSRGLTTFPDHIPPDTFDLKMTNNRIRNVPYIPPLRYLNILDLSRNRIETLSWQSLCNLPSATNIYLNQNKITGVKFEDCIHNLSKLRLVDLASNMIASLSESDLGLPLMKAKILLVSNPFRCDSKLEWLVKKFKCLKEQIPEACDVSFLSNAYYQNHNFHCDSPVQLRAQSLSDVSISELVCVTTPLSTTEGAVYSTRQSTHGTSQRNVHPGVPVIQQAQSTPAFGNTTKNGGLTAGTAIVKRDKPVFRTVHIIIMTTAGLLGLVFAVCLTLKFVRECRLQNANRAANNISVPLRVLSTDNQSTSQTGPPSAIELSQLIPNSLYNRNNPAAMSHVQTTTNTQLSQLVPPIANSLYHRNSPATMPEQPRLPTPLPPIQNVSYHSTNPAALSSEEPDRTYEYIP